LFLGKILVNFKDLIIRTYRSQVSNCIKNHLVGYTKTLFLLIIAVLINSLLLSIVQDLVIPAMPIKQPLIIPLSNFRSVY
jgi:hypothetical protein